MAILPSAAIFFLQVEDILNGISSKTFSKPFEMEESLKNGTEAKLDGEWDLMIAHPPCTYLSVSGATVVLSPDDGHLPTPERPHPKYPDRTLHRKEAIDFFKNALAEAKVPRIAVENPISIISECFENPTKLSIHPGCSVMPQAKRLVCGSRSLSPLTPTKIVDKLRNNI